MRIFVAGATGLLGKRVVRQLVTGGHEVRGLSRSPANRERLAALGAAPCDCDVFDAGSVTRAAEGCDAVLHLATRIPGRQRSTLAHWAENDRLRRDGTRALVAAAVAHGARYLQQSVAWLYGDGGEEWLDETAAAPPEGAVLPGSIVSSIDTERIVREAVAAHRLRATILRGGAFYAADSPQTRRLVSAARRRLIRFPGDGRQFVSLIHIDDMAAAVVAATLAEDAPASAVYNVVDDEPVRFRELIDFLCERAGRKPVGGAPRWLLRLALGKPVADTMFGSLRVSNRLLKERLGWAPRFPSYREGFDQVLAELRV